MRITTSRSGAFLCALSLSVIAIPASIADRLIDSPSTSDSLPVPVDGIIDENAPGWVWRGSVAVSDPMLHGGAAMAGGPNCYGSYTFQGTGVEVFCIKGPAVTADGRAHKSGRIQVSIDGKLRSETSLYSSTSQDNVSAFKIDNLPNGNHVLELEAAGGWIAVDYIKVAVPAAISGTGGAGANINFGQGFSDVSEVKFNGSARPYGNGILMTNGQGNEVGSIFFMRQVNTEKFTARFRFQFAKDTQGDGLTFCLQSAGPSAVGAWGGEMGYKGIDRSVAVKFDLFDNYGEGRNSTGIYFNGAYPALPAADLAASGIDLHAGNPVDVVISYDGKLLKVKETDAVTQATAAQSYQIDIPLYTGRRAYAGFTASMGGAISTSFIQSWTM